MTATGTVHLGPIPVGDGHPAVLVAEIGTFFNQSMDLARTFLRQAVAAGAPVFKTEVLHDPDVCLPASGLVHEYSHATGTAREDYRALIERKCNPLSHYADLFALCRELGVPFIATVYDPEGVDLLLRSGAAGIKIARDNVNNLPLIRRAAATGLPVVFDAGLVHLHEIAAAVHEARSHGAGGVIVNHHPGHNPAPAEVHNLAAIAAYKHALGVPVGLACHYRGEEILYAAVGAGANLLEKGVVDDPDRIEQDLVSAAPLSRLADIVSAIESCSKALGTFPFVIPRDRDLSTRKGIVAARFIKAGEALSADCLRAAWPPVGIAIEHWDQVIAGKAVRDLARLEPVGWEDVQF